MKNRVPNETVHNLLALCLRINAMDGMTAHCHYSGRTDEINIAVMRPGENYTNCMIYQTIYLDRSEYTITPDTVIKGLIKQLEAIAAGTVPAVTETQS